MKENINNPENFESKKINENDSAKYWKIRQEMVLKDPQAFGYDPKEDEEYWKKDISNPDNSFYCFEKNGEYISTAASLSRQENFRLIKNVYTKEEFRGKSLSKNLLDIIINEAKNNGVKKLGLWVNWVDSPQIAKQMYEKLGFKKVNEHKDPNSDFVSEYMEKDL